MTPSQNLVAERTEHPVDVVERLAALNEWAFDRADEDEISILVSGAWTQYEVAFTWLPDWDEEATETLVRFDLDERDGVTAVRLTHSGFAAAGSRARHQGWPQILSWLQGYAEG